MGKRPSHLISQACDFCRERHMKCDGENPCCHCAKRVQTCNYSSHKKRGPKPKNRKIDEGYIVKLPVVKSEPWLPSINVCDGAEKAELTMLFVKLKKVKQRVEYWKKKYQILSEAQEVLGEHNQHNQIFSPSLVRLLYDSQFNLYLIQSYNKIVSPLFSYLTVQPEAYYKVSSSISHRDVMMRTRDNVELCVLVVEICIASALGASLLSHRDIANGFAQESADLLMFVFKHADCSPELIQRIFHCLLLLSYYFLCLGDVSKANTWCTMAYSIRVNSEQHISEISKNRLVCFLVLTNGNEAMKIKWWSEAIENLNPESDPYNLFFLCLVYLLRNTLVLQSKTRILEDAAYNRILALLQQWQSKAKDDWLCKKMSEDQYDHTLVTISGFKALACYNLDKQLSSALATGVIEKCFKLDVSNCHLGVPVALYFSLLVCKNLKYSMYQRGLIAADKFATIYPITNKHCLESNVTPVISVVKPKCERPSTTIINTNTISSTLIPENLIPPTKSCSSVLNMQDMIANTKITDSSGDYKQSKNNSNIPTQQRRNSISILFNPMTQTNESSTIVLKASEASELPYPSNWVENSSNNSTKLSFDYSFMDPNVTYISKGYFTRRSFGSFSFEIPGETDLNLQLHLNF